MLHSVGGGDIANAGRANDDTEFDFVVRYNAFGDFDGGIVGDVGGGGFEEEEWFGGDGVVQLFGVCCVVAADPVS